MKVPIDSQAAAATFWGNAGGRERYGRPADVEMAASSTLNVAVQRIAGLDTSGAVRLLRRIGAPPWFDGVTRPLRGCLIADAGHALVLVEKNDPDDEQRLTIAHEVAHLLCHYLAPRNRAIQHFGPGILAVLDRTRALTYGERLSAAMRGVPVEPIRHAMERGNGIRAREIERLEAEADDLAVELLAPWFQLKRMRGASPGEIREQFGLPPRISAGLASLIAPSDNSSGTLGLFSRK
ncbi:ImmA/IrrE family metallo-endopeptidase [Mesorhizobium sp. M1143]|uniref:ImmA/IrrE family metallo-endopeptidase n=1 Tax=Mesorhizobium sp. M1143 TaxID=2957061 RepID=UPI00333B2F10